MDSNAKITELVEYDISVFKQMSPQDKIEFVENLLFEKYETYSAEDISSIFESLKG